MVQSRSRGKETCNRIQLVPFFRRFAIKHPDYDPYGKGQNADILYSVEKIDGKLLITQATHVWWNSSGETGVWPSR